MLPPRLILLWSLPSLTSFARAQNASAVYVPKSANHSYPSWNITVSGDWDWRTVLNLTGRSSMVTDPKGTIANYTHSKAFPPTDIPDVYVNGNFNVYASNAMNYALLSDMQNLTGYSDEKWVIPTTCEYPISGQYSRLNRILYYVLLVFALVVHHHEWLVAGALASATIYSGCAAVQALAQFIVVYLKRPYASAGDNDVDALQGIIAAGLLMAVPLINWSRTLRRLQARPILIYWAIILFVGYVFVLIQWKETDIGSNWDRTGGGYMICDTREAIAPFDNLGFIDNDFIQKYRCTDPCFNPAFRHPLRDTSSVVNRLACNQFYWSGKDSPTDTECFAQCPRSLSDNCTIETSGWSDRDYTIQDVGYYVTLPVAIFELFFVLFFGRKSPEEIRESMFRFLVGSTIFGNYRIMPAEKRKARPMIRRERVRIVAAQAGAILFYFFAALTYLVCLPFFVFNIVWQERLLPYFPDQESPNEVSQWLPWVGIVLTLGAAVVGKYHHTWKVFILHYLHGGEKRRSAPIRAAKTKSANTASWIRRSTWRTMGRLTYEWRDFKDFWNTPFFLLLDEDRERTRDHPTVKYAFFGSLPFPEKDERNSKKHYQGPWVKNDDWQNFDVEFQVEADGRTLGSWEHYQQGLRQTHGAEQRIIYSVQLPTVPHYPDKRTVIAKAKASHVQEKVVIDPNLKKSPDVSEAIVPGATRRPTVSFSLQQEMDAAATAVASGTNRGSQSDDGTASVSSGQPTLNQTQSANAPRNFTPSPGDNGGPLRSHTVQTKRTEASARPQGNEEEKISTVDNAPSSHA